MAPACSWDPPPEDLALKSGEVHIWCANLDLHIAQVQRFLRILSSDERAKAEQFHFQSDRRRFILARGVLRTILSRYLNVEPQLLRFHHGPRGKPILTGDRGSDGEGAREEVVVSVRELAGGLLG